MSQKERRGSDSAQIFAEFSCDEHRPKRLVAIAMHRSFTPARFRWLSRHKVDRTSGMSRPRAQGATPPAPFGALRIEDTNPQACRFDESCK
jgi:hypothetical protein